MGDRMGFNEPTAFNVIFTGLIIQQGDYSQRFPYIRLPGWGWWEKLECDNRSWNIIKKRLDAFSTVAFEQ